jgi:hypothetical protein
VKDERSRLFHASLLKGRLWLVVIWIALRALDAAIFISMRRAHNAHNAQMLVFLFSDVLWSTTLLIAVGCRQAWAKFGLVAIVGMGIAWDVIHISQAAKDTQGLFVIDCIGRALVMVVILRSWGIKRLTSRAYE